MSRSNPKKAMAALIPPGQAVIRPMTLGMYAALERISSPLVTGVEAKDALELLPSLYLLTHDPREVFRGNILDLAMQWADTQPIEAVVAIRDAALEEIRAMLDVTPEQDSDKPKKKTTGGSRNGSTGPRTHTDGRSRRSCGKYRQAQSPSCGGRKSYAGTSRSSSRSR